MKALLTCLGLAACLVFAPNHSLAQTSKQRVGLLLDKAGKDDQSFNASAYQGLMLATNELGLSSKTVEAKDSAAANALLRAMSRKKFDPLIAIGFSMAGAVRSAALFAPQSRFVIVDSEVRAANVTSILFAEHEGSFLMGAMAALKSKSKVIGFIGGMDVPLIRRFEWGYKAGANYIAPDIKVLSSFMGITGDAFNNPPKMKELALYQNAQGADVVFHAAGASGRGLFDAAEEKKFYAIGVDSNQNHVKPGVVLTSMVKRVDLAVSEAIRFAATGSLKGAQTIYHDFSTGGISMALDKYNQALFTPEMITRAEEIKQKIISKKIIVPDYYLRDKHH